MSEITNKIHKANMQRWDAAAEHWAKMADSRGIWNKCTLHPSLALSTEVLEILDDLINKKVCVLGSGDNEAVFAFAGMGAENESKEELTIENPYLHRGPYKYYLNEDVLIPSAGEFESFEHHWSIADFVNALIINGFRIEKMIEYGDQVADWERARFNGLPECSLLQSYK